MTLRFVNDNRRQMIFWWKAYYNFKHQSAEGYQNLSSPFTSDLCYHFKIWYCNTAKKELL